MLRKFIVSLLVFGTLFFTSAVTMVFADHEPCCRDQPGYERVDVSGTAVHYFATKIVHRSQQSKSGRRETTTETIDLVGDLEGRVLYQPTGHYDFERGVLVNTGRQVFSGTIRGSEPVIIYDDKYRFDIHLNSGEVNGKVFLDQSISGPKISCELVITGSSPPEDKADSSYAGVCWIKKKS